jgi:hypothetical protein
MQNAKELDFCDFFRKYKFLEKQEESCKTGTRQEGACSQEQIAVNCLHRKSLNFDHHQGL